MKRRIQRKTKEQLAFDKFVKGWKNWPQSKLSAAKIQARILYDTIGFKDTIRFAVLNDMEIKNKEYLK